MCGSAASTVVTPRRVTSCASTRKTRIASMSGCTLSLPPVAPGWMRQLLGDSLRGMRAAAAEDDGAHLLRPLEERPAPPAAPTHPCPGHDVESVGGPCPPPCPRCDGGARC